VAVCKLAAVSCRTSRSTPTTAAAFFSGAAGKHRSPASAAEQRRGPAGARQTASGGGRSAAPARGASPVVDEDSVAVGGEQDGSVGQFLVESLTAQSLDLPPQVRRQHCDRIPLRVVAHIDHDACYP